MKCPRLTCQSSGGAFGSVTFPERLRVVILCAVPESSRVAAEEGNPEGRPLGLFFGLLVFRVLVFIVSVFLHCTHSLV